MYSKYHWNTIHARKEVRAPDEEGRTRTPRVDLKARVDLMFSEQPTIINEILLLLYLCMVTHIARVWINRVRLPVLHVVS